jgi:hypothetical protein
MNQNGFKMDIIGERCWYMMFVTPLIGIPIVWKFSSQTNGVKLLIGLLLAFALSVFLFFFSLAILFRNGMGS